jgi:hypothetical protein
MDKVRAFLTVVWQQRFWVLSVLGVVVAVICWKLAASSLDAEFTTYKQQIDAKFNDMTTIINSQVRGNDDVNEKERAQAIVIRNNVVGLWQTLYDAQKKVLKWPVQLGDEFLEEVESKRFRDPISNDMLQVYREYAKEAFPDLVAIVQAKKMADDGTFGGGFAGGRDGGGGFDAGRFDPALGDVPQYDADGNLIEPEKYLVQWLDQGLLRQRLMFQKLPTPLQVWVTQEDLWVYQTLLNAIKDTNEAFDSTRPDNAAIRVIVALEVGRPAALASKVRGAVILPPMVSAVEGAVDGGGRDSFGTDGTAMGVSPDAALMMSRYIGPDGQPIVDASTDPGGEFRMLPVRMQLMMKQEAIPEVIAQCANASLPVEVKRVRINPEKSGAGFPTTFELAATAGAGMTDGGFVGGRGGEFDGGGRGGSFDGGGRGGEGMTMPATAMTSGMATVEILGVVYIYNPPDAATLTIPGGDSAAIASSETPASPR